MAYWKLLNLAFVDRLEQVTIELPNGTNGIELASYMLKHAKSLKKMVMVHSPNNLVSQESYFKHIGSPMSELSWRMIKKGELI